MMRNLKTKVAGGAMTVFVCSICKQEFDKRATAEEHFEAEAHEDELYDWCLQQKGKKETAAGKEDVMTKLRRAKLAAGGTELEQSKNNYI